MRNNKTMKITGIQAVSAIYFALLQSGYDFYGMGRSEEHASAVKQFIGGKDIPSFFAGVKQNTCAVYPYWPRAAILETALFYLRPDQRAFLDYHGFQQNILESGNIADHERDQALWTWVQDFPSALSSVLACDAFERYLAWEQDWLTAQNAKHMAALQQITDCLDICVSKYQSPVKDIQIVVNPIKCVYSADYHLFEQRFVYCSGAFHAESVIHEFLHHVVHPALEDIADRILAVDHIYAELDPSYYLSGDDAGKLNAFEEHAVRMLTKDVVAGTYPDDLPYYLQRMAAMDAGV